MVTAKFRWILFLVGLIIPDFSLMWGEISSVDE